MSDPPSFPASACSSTKLPVARCVAPDFREGRKTVAVLVDFIDQTTDGYESALRAGFEAQCRVRDLNLLIVVGRALEEPDFDSAHHNEVYPLVVPQCVAGLILISAGLSYRVGPSHFKRWCESFGPLPVCSIGIEIPGFPSIIADNHAGMCAVVEHIVVHHGRKRIAYLTCERNADALDRLDVCRRVMAKQGLALDPDLVMHASFEMSRAEQAISDLLDKGAKFDAVIAANDGMAVGALRSLTARGIRVPEDVLISGFDDIPITRFTEPTITTVRQPLQRMAELAVDSIADQLEGLAVEARITVPSQLLVRNSCGCERQVAFVASTVPALGAAVSNGITDEDLSELAKQATAVLQGEADTGEYEALQMAKAIFAELSGQKGSLLKTVERLLRELSPNENGCDTLLPLLAALRLQTSAIWPQDFEDVWHAAQKAISNSQARFQAERRLQTESMYVSLLRTASFVVVSRDMLSLRRGLEEILPAIHKKDLLIGLIPEDGAGQVEALLALRNGEISPAPGGTITLSQFLAGEQSRRRTMFVLPITSDSRLIGIVAIEAQDAFFNYQLLRDHISAAFRVISLQEEAVRQTTLRERSVQERLATAERMRSLSVLAGGVAHDLNNALGSLVALSDVVLEELDEHRKDPEHDDTEMRTDLVSIKLGALRAAETIKDLMTLGRRSQVLREPLDLSQTVHNSVRDARVQLSSERFKAVQIYLEASTALPILGSEPQVMRAVSNLLRNAIEAAGSGGVVVVRTDSVRLTEPLLVYEAVPVGEYASVSIADTGPGIPSEHLNKVFEPFFSTKKLSEISGSGLGLAIVHSVVKEHGGFLDVSSRVGEGTKFTLYFPRVDAVTQLPVAPDPVRVGRAKVLAVDDDPIQLRVAHRVLSRLGYAVTTLTSGAQAYRLLCAELPQRIAGGQLDKPVVSAFDVLIMDMALNEDQTGFEVFQNVRKVFPAQKGIIASGHSVKSEDSSIASCDLIWLAKPYTAACLAQAVQALLGHSG